MGERDRETIALSKTPFDLLRGSGGDEKLLKNAKDACASEALEIATYTALQRLAGSVGDQETTQLATSILAKIDSYERKNQNCTTVLSRITSLRGNEPWAGYDELTASEVQSVLSEGDDERVKEVRSYERTHKHRTGVLNAAERELANA